MLKSSFLIIGGGIVGHLIAWKICHAYPWAVVRLLERDMIGSGASLRSAGLHFPLGRTAEVRAMSESSEDFYKNFLETHPEAPIAALGLRVHAKDSVATDLGRIFTTGARLAPDPEDGNVSRLLGSKHRRWRAQGAQRADVVALTHCISKLLDRRLISHTGIKVARITESDSAVRVFTKDGFTFEADTAILAPGPWALAPEFAPFTGSLDIRIKRVVAFHINASHVGDDQDDVVDLFIDEDAFLMPRTAGGRLFSFTRQQWDVLPGKSGGDISADDREEAARVLTSIAPRLSDDIVGGQAFCDAYNPTRTPIVHGVGRFGRIIFAGATNGSGYRLAPAIADCVLANVATRNTKEMVG